MDILLLAVEMEQVKFNLTYMYLVDLEVQLVVKEHTMLQPEVQEELEDANLMIAQHILKDMVAAVVAAMGITEEQIL